MKTHWIRKHLSCGPLFCSYDGEIKNRYFYDIKTACGRRIVNGTVFRKKVTCKTCLRIMKKNEKDK